MPLISEFYPTSSIMKNHRSSKVVLGFVLGLFLSVQMSSAQGVQLQGGILYGSDNVDLGVKLGATLPVAETVKAGGNFVIYFPGNDLSVWSLNGNAYYAIPMDSGIGLSAFAGLNYTSFSFDNEVLQGFGVDASSSNIGLNLGGMAEFGDGPLGFYVDAKIVIGDGGRFEFGGGATFDI
jgi:hypothetical protein